MRKAVFNFEIEGVIPVADISRIQSGRTLQKREWPVPLRIAPCHCILEGNLVEVDPLHPMHPSSARVAPLNQQVRHQLILNGKVELLEHRELGGGDVCAVETSTIRTEGVRRCEGAELRINNRIHLDWSRECVKRPERSLPVSDRHIY